MKPPAAIETARLRLRARRWAVHPNIDPTTPRDFWCYARVKETP